MQSDSQYAEFLRSKKIMAKPMGFDIDPASILATAKPFQRDIIQYMLRIGRGAIFEECGLGKTLQQLEWAYHVAKKTRGVVLGLCPLAVAGQTLREAEWFGITRGELPIMVAARQDDVPFTNGIVITNYEKLKHFRPQSFAGVFLDESSILKSYNGKTKQGLCDSFADTPYRLACTATPSPNDLMELGNHSEFLGAMRSSEMLMRWFINDTAHVGKYRLRGHAEADYWEWVASWAVSLASPADLGYDDSAYILPPLEIIEHVVEDDLEASPLTGQLFKNETINATTMHAAKRQSVDRRAEVVAGLVRHSSEPWVVWCDTDYESEALMRAINLGDECVEVRGSMTEFRKEQNIERFSTEQARVIVTKPKICGFGLNWQHCRNTAFVGLSYSFEQFYQAIRRLYRFGQKRPVFCHVVNSEAEQCIWQTVRRKEADHRGLQGKMAAAMRESQMKLVRGVMELRDYRPETAMKIPAYLRSKARA